MKKQRVLSTLLAAALFSSLFSVTASARTYEPVEPVSVAAKATTTVKIKTQPISLVFDGQALKLPDGQYSFIYQGRTYVPIRYISYALQKSVNWDGAKASVSEPTEQQLAALKKHLQSVTKGNAKPQASVDIHIQPVKAKLEFDGKMEAMPAGQTLFGYKGSIYVPLRFLSESVGTQIGWDSVTKTVSGESAAYRAEQQAGGGVTPGTGEGSTGTTPGDTGGSAEVLTYVQITAEAEAKLEVLRNGCQSKLLNIALLYVGADDAGKVQLKAQGLQELNICSANFEVIMTGISAKLTANGHSTAIIAEYRAAFSAELEAGRAIAESLS
ncbi:stalk domain-containing protein [Paenibacillus sp. sgz302251]|uniref:stalk domain-containing protein n=1 Tax=Paenibacillus sp. sgz302251 TaxID=3414493 RepID=UPI003C7D2F87